MNFNSSVVAWDKFGDSGKRRYPFFGRDQYFEAHRWHHDATHTSAIRGFAIIVVGGKGLSESIAVSIHSEETLESTVDQIMERDAVENAASRVSQKVPVIGTGDVCGVEETEGQLHGSSTTSREAIRIGTGVHSTRPNRNREISKVAEPFHPTRTAVAADPCNKEGMEGSSVTRKVPTAQGLSPI